MKYIECWPLQCLYSLWLLEQNDVETFLASHGRLDLSPPILCIPRVVTVVDGITRPIYPPTKRSVVYDRTPVVVPLNDSKLFQQNPTLVEFYRQLLDSTRHYPFTRDKIIQLISTYQRESSSTMKQHYLPPLLRSLLWPMMLGVKGNVTLNMERVERESPPLAASVIDQLAKDIPRCHQYHHVLHSERGQANMTAVLSAWVRSDPSHSYWQGLDSVCAPFVATFLDHPAQAFACLQRITSIYLRDFSDPDNTAFQLRMEQLLQLLHFHDPILARHLATIQFHPRLYAVPWFYTLFSHILPLDQVFALWDVVLVKPPAFVLFVAIGILCSLRDKLLPLDFDGAVAFFANSIEIRIP